MAYPPLIRKFLELKNGAPSVELSSNLMTLSRRINALELEKYGFVYPEADLAKLPDPASPEETELQSENGSNING